MKKDIVKKQETIFCLLAKFGEAMSSPRRLKIIGLLSQGKKCVEQLSDMTGQSIAATSAHLKVLRASGLVEGHKVGRQVWCRLAGESVTRVWLALRDLGEELLPEVREIIREYFEDPETLSTLTMEEVLEEVLHKRVTLLDLRTAAEFEQGHLPDALHIPLDDLESRLTELPVDRPLLAYCRGPYCVTALNGASALRQFGRTAQRLRFGVPEWRAANLPVSYSNN